MLTSQRSKVFMVYVLAFLASFGVPLTVPLLPFIMKDFALDSTQIGLMISCYALPGIFMIPLCGVLADRVGRKQLLLPGTLLCIISSLGCMQAANYTEMLLWRILQGLAVTPIEVLSNSLITDMFHGKDRITYLGRNVSAMYVGLATFPVLSSVMLALAGWRSAFLLPALTALAAFILLMRVEMPFKPAGEKVASYAADVRKTLLNFCILRLFVMQLLTVMIVFGVVIVHLPIVLTQKLSASPHLLGPLFAFSSLVQVYFSANIGKMSHRHPQNLLGAFASCCMIVACLGFLFMPHVWLLLLPLFFYGVSQGMQPALLTVNVVNLAPENARATILAINSMVFRIGQLFAPMLCALLFQMGSFTWLFGFGIILSLTMGVLAWFTLGTTSQIYAKSKL